MPFLLGIVIAPVALYIRRQLPETIEPSETHASARAVLADLVRHHARPVLFGVLIICGGTIATYVFTYMTTYAITTLKLSAAVGTTLALTGYLAQAARCDAGRVERALRTQADAGGDARAVCAADLSGLRDPDVAGASLAAIFVVNMALQAVFAIGMGTVYAFLAEAFPKAVRSSGLSILYALGTTIFGGTTQFVVAWLIDRTGSPMVPAWYMLAATLAAIAGVARLKPHPEAVREHSAHAAPSRPRVTGLSVGRCGYCVKQILDAELRRAR